MASTYFDFGLGLSRLIVDIQLELFVLQITQRSNLLSVGQSSRMTERS